MQYKKVTIALPLIKFDFFDFDIFDFSHWVHVYHQIVNGKNLEQNQSHGLRQNVWKLVVCFL